jgi:pumilio homology domain family member 6
MPTATTTKSAMAGMKRKSAPVKNAHAKESKKPKIDSGMKSALKTKTKPVPVKVEEASNEDSEDSDSDGGVPLNFESDDSDDVAEIDQEEREEENDSEELPTTTDGLHPERAKAVVTNSKNLHFTSRMPH